MYIVRNIYIKECISMSFYLYIDTLIIFIEVYKLNIYKCKIIGMK